MSLSGQSAFAEDGVAARYRLNDGPDVASELILSDDHTFEYFLMAGSLDEQARGSWRIDGQTLRLQTMPKPVPAAFSQGQATPSADKKISIHVTSPGGRGIESVHLTLGFDEGPPVDGYTQEYGWSLEASETRVPRWIELSVPIYGLRSPRFPIDLSRGGDLAFILTPNDLGTIDFEGIQIDIRPHQLVMHRRDAVLTFDAAEETAISQSAQALATSLRTPDQRKASSRSEMAEA